MTLRVKAFYNKRNRFESKGRLKEGTLKDWIDEAMKEQESYMEVLTFDDYMEKVKENPLRQMRTSAIYLKDMFDFFGKNENGIYKLFLRKCASSSSVYGQENPQHDILRNITNFIEEGFNNKFILLVGPNGSSKTSIVRKIMEGAEEYSKFDEGSLYTFSWIFPIDQYIKGGLGLGANTTESDLKSFAHLDDKEISSILVSDLKDHPFLLIPTDHRQKIIDNLLKENPYYLESIKKTYLYNGDISKRNRMIFDALLKSYQGDYKMVLKHIRIERFLISKRYSVSAVSIEPQLHVDLRMQQITMDKRLASLPPSLQSLNLFTLSGENVMANRGVLEFSDLLKRPLDAFKYLLMTMESKTINLQGILTELDIFFIGTSNEIHLSAFKQHPDYHSFRGRINFVRVPYLLNYEYEEMIYQEQANSLKEKVNFEPKALETLCLWSVMTRLRPPMLKSYKEKSLADIVITLNPLEKSILYTKKTAPKRFDSEERRILKSNRDFIKSEFNHDSLYEGKFGISPREIKQIIYEISEEHKIVTFVEVLEYLDSFVQRRNEYDFLNIAPQGDYNNPEKFIQLLRDYQLDILDQHLRDSLGLIDDRSYEDYIAKYVLSINCLLKGEKMKNNITGRYEEVDMYFIKEFENNLKLQESAESFRSYTISTLGAFALDHPNGKIVYTEVFPDIVKTLKESFREEQKKVISQMAKNLVFYIDEIENKKKEKNTALTKEAREQITNVLSNLEKRFHYSPRGALTLVKYLIKNRY